MSHGPNTVEESIPLTQRPPKPVTQQSTAGSKPKKKFSWKTVRKAVMLMLRPEAPVREAPNAWKSIRAIISASCKAKSSCNRWTLLILSSRAKPLAGLYSNIRMLLSTSARTIWRILTVDHQLCSTWSAYPYIHLYVSSQLSLHPTLHRHSLISRYHTARPGSLISFRDCSHFDVRAASCICHRWNFPTSWSNSRRSPQCYISQWFTCRFLSAQGWRFIGKCVGNFFAELITFLYCFLVPTASNSSYQWVAPVSSSLEDVQLTSISRSSRSRNVSLQSFNHPVCPTSYSFAASFNPRRILFTVVGSILSNLCRCLTLRPWSRLISPLVLVLGMCFFAGGLRFSEQGFGQSKLSPVPAADWLLIHWWIRCRTT
jgi:hypothetical protein